ncbi:MAG: ribonuclease HII [Opitutaceae bacterium]
MNKLQQHDGDRLQSIDWLVGIDEAGRGCLAGPVVAGACVLNATFFESENAVELSAQINDSKQLTAEARESQFVVLKQLQADGLLDFAVASGSVAEIAELNILGATRLAMQRAVEALAGRANGWELPAEYCGDALFAHRPDDTPSARGRGEVVPPVVVSLIVDGRPLKPFPYKHEGIVKGDGKSLSIAMASIAAKVTRDREMKALAVKYPEYGFEVHKGYGTKKHRDALHTNGPSPIHRELFLRKILGL